VNIVLFSNSLKSLDEKLLLRLIVSKVTRSKHQRLFKSIILIQKRLIRLPVLVLTGLSLFIAASLEILFGETLSIAEWLHVLQNISVALR
jgi:hypothetical protein